MMKTYLKGFPPFPKPLPVTVPLGKANVNADCFPDTAQTRGTWEEGGHQDLAW